MFRRYSWYWVKVFQITDASIIVVAWFLTKEWPFQNAQLNLSANLSSIMILILSWAAVARLFTLYNSKRLVPLYEEVKMLIVVVIFYCFLINIFASSEFLAHPKPLLLAVFVLLGIVSFHLFLRFLLRYIRLRGFNQRRTLIYGTGREGRYTASNLISRPYTGMKIVGFLDNDPSKQGKIIRCHSSEIPVLSTNGGIRHLIDKLDIHEVITALPSSAHERLKKFILETSDLNVNVCVVPDLFDLISVKTHSEDILGVPVIGVRQPCIDVPDAIVKRVIDIVSSAIGLVVVAPIIAAIALLIKLDSKGPILFRQGRIGLNGKPFQMYKFRTMVNDAEKRLDELIKVEDLSQPMFKINGDPRVTRVGRILRKASLDELPQFYNVLIGDMSLVGPRPEEVRIVCLYSYEQRQRLAVKPGITGPMQVNGRGDLSFEDRLGLEINYIKDYSLYDDLVILAKTVPAVLLGKGAH